MAERKIFAGTRLRRLRQKRGLSQTEMAAEIGVSPSYLNLIERNQRPLTVQVLLKLSNAYGVDVAELSGGDDPGVMEALKEVFSDPLLSGEIASPTEIAEFVEAAPNAARATARLFQAYREGLERLSDLAHRLTREGEAPPETAAQLPLGQAAAYFEEAGPFFPAIEAEAEAIAGDLKPRDDPHEALRRHLEHAFKVDLRVLPAHVMPIEQLRYDRHTLRLFISERVPLIERPFLLARQIAWLGHRALIDRLSEEAGMTQAEATRICRHGFARRLAEAIVAPAGRFASAARDNSANIMLLSQRFVLAPSRAMARLATLGADGRSGLAPAFMLTLNGAGEVLTRIPGGGFPFPRLAPFCSRLPLFDALSPGQPSRNRGRAPRRKPLPCRRAGRGGHCVRRRFSAAAPGVADRLAAGGPPRRGRAFVGRAADRRHLPALRTNRLRPPHAPTDGAARRLPGACRRAGRL